MAGVAERAPPRRQPLFNPLLTAISTRFYRPLRPGFPTIAFMKRTRGMPQPRRALRAQALPKVLVVIRAAAHAPHRTRGGIMRSVSNGLVMATAVALLAGAAGAVGPPSAPLSRCPLDAVMSGTVCMDKYEASVWRVPNPTTVNQPL